MHHRNPLNICLACLIFWTTSTPAEELSKLNFNGLQLAFTRLPTTPVDKEQATVTKPEKIETQAPKSSAEPIEKPVEAQPIKPAQTQATSRVPEKSVTTANSSKQTGTARLEWVLGVGADFGGGVLGQVTYSDGSTAIVNANKGIAFFAGANIQNGSDNPFSTMITLGYKTGSPQGIGGEIIWSAVPIEVIEFFNSSSLRMGLGLSYQLNPQLSVNVTGSSFVDKYNNTIGFIVQAGWAPVRQPISIDLRYTAINFQSDTVQGPTSVDGNVFGIYSSYRF